MDKENRMNIDDAQNEASNLVKDKKRLELLLERAAVKLRGITSSSDNMTQFVKQLKLVLQMLRATLSGEYKNLSLTTVISLVAGLVYFVSPVDMIPDFIPFVGYVDDLSVLVWIFRNLSQDIDQFEKWQTRVN